MTATIASDPDTRRRRVAGSALVVVVLSYAVLLAYPTELVPVGPLKSNGGAVRILGLLAAFLVLAGVIRPGRRFRVRPVAGILLGYLAWSIFAWGTAHRRPLSAYDSALADRALLGTVSAIGIALLCTHLVWSVARANVLLGCLVGGATFSAVVGVMQFAGLIGPLADAIAPPFFTTVTNPGGVTSRGGLSRVSGAASHPIEFAVVLAMVFPLAVHLAIHARSVAGRRMALIACGVIAIGFPLGLSRSGLLAISICVVTYSLFLPRRERGLLLGGAAFLTAAVTVVAPQVVDTFLKLISGAGEDNSIVGRLDDYPRAIAQWRAAPWLGGEPPDPRVVITVLDNQWLNALVTGGVVGVAAFALLLLAPMFLAGLMAREAPAGSAGRSLAGALIASMLSVLATAATFDLLNFQQAAFLVFFLAALVGVNEETVIKESVRRVNTAERIDRR